jgi:hypothetical protein
VCLFVEVDFGSESHSVWQQKIQAYLSFAVSGEFHERFRQKQFCVLVVTNSEGRLPPNSASPPLIQ